MARYRMKRRYVNRLWVILAIFFICAALAVTGILLYQRIAQEKELPLSAEAKIEVMDGRILAVERGELIGFNGHAKEMFRQRVPGASEICVGDGAAAVYGIHDVYLVRKNGRIDAHISTDADVRQVLCGAGIICVVTEDEAGNMLVSCYDTYANLIDLIDSADLLQDDVLMRAGMQDNVLWLTTCNTTGAGTLCHTYVFNVQKNAFLCRIDVYDQLICDIFMDEKNVFVIGTDSILCYNYNGMRQWQMPAADLTYVTGCHYRQNAALLFAYDDMPGGRMVYRTQSYALFETPIGCDCADGKLYILTQEALGTINLRGEMHTLQLLQQEAYEQLHLVSSNRMLVFDGDRWVVCMIP
ncbi:MAG: hypothetical protein J6L88_00015 [Clostridia bacterium]|nr:hypothetical protein [Clostridia bacterium]